MTEPATIHDESDGQLTTGEVAGTPAAPAVNPPPPSVRIPDGDTADAALAILASVNPSAAAELRGRIAAIGDALSDAVESARLDATMGVVQFIRRSARLIQLRRSLEERLRRLQGTAEASGGQTAEEEIHELTRAVKRWRDGREIMQEGTPIIGRVRSALDAAGEEINSLVASYLQGHSYVVKRESATVQAGLSSRDDEFLRRLEEWLRVRASLSGRLCRLDPYGDTHRAGHVARVLDTAGGSDAVREALKPAMVADASKLQAARAEIKSLNDQLEGVDPETRRAGALARLRDELQARVESLAGQVDAARTAAADSILRVARLGIREGIATLASIARAVTTGVAEQLEQLGCTDAELTAVVAEIITPQPVRSPQS